ncbi:hypothetical protein EYC80_005383 [Monilinia laxa]|uniref:Uncharacterized protein n=1 Tax=Monilinia laxa TaxID=61186 RepID=A0A5N6KK24_MONLA|nr:hypothetical protein EYC80_005383 [Monilinia laxa]
MFHGKTSPLQSKADSNLILSGGLFAPEILSDSIRRFAYPLGNGHLPLLTLPDLDSFAFSIFTNRSSFSGLSLATVSHFAAGSEIASTFTKMTGLAVIYAPVSIEEWSANLGFADRPVISTDPQGIIEEENFKIWWAGFEDSILWKLSGERRVAGRNME